MRCPWMRGKVPRTEFEAKKINQRCNSCMTNLVRTVYNVTRNHRLMCMIRNLLGNRRFFVELEGIRSRWRSQRKCLHQESVLAPLLFNVYTNDQPIHPGTRSFVYADDLAVTTQSTDFAPIEETRTNLSSSRTVAELHHKPYK